MVPFLEPDVGTTSGHCFIQLVPQDVEEVPWGQGGIYSLKCSRNAKSHQTKTVFIQGTSDNVYASEFQKSARVGTASTEFLIYMAVELYL